MNIPALRARLKAAAAREPEELQPVAGLLSKQLGAYGRGGDEDKAALRPEILKSVANIEKATAGR